jgi:hypothetical protein
VVDAVTGAADALGLTRVAATASPIAGAEGNREFFLHFRQTSHSEPRTSNPESQPSDLEPRSSILHPPSSD